MLGSRVPAREPTFAPSEAVLTPPLCSSRGVRRLSLRNASRWSAVGGSRLMSQIHLSPSYWLVEPTPTRVIEGWPATVSYAY